MIYPNKYEPIRKYKDTPDPHRIISIEDTYKNSDFLTIDMNEIKDEMYLNRNLDYENKVYQNFANYKKDMLELEDYFILEFSNIN